MKYRAARKMQAIATLVVFLMITLMSCSPRSFIKENLKTFHEFKLQNGIPVVVKQNSVSRIQSVVLMIDGGKTIVPPDKAGLDTVALKLMSMASERYPDVQRRALLKKTSGSISAAADLDFSTVHLKTIDTYFAQTFDLYTDILLHPTFPEALLQEVLTNLTNKYRSDLTDGYARVSLAANRAFFEGHPYRSCLYTPQTLARISLQDVKTFYRQNMVAARIAIFAVGNFNLDAFRKRLNKTFGALPPGEAPAAPAPPIARSAASRLVLDANADLSPDVSYIRGNFAMVPAADSDYWPLVLAGKIVSDIMTDIIRTKYSLAYSVWTQIYSKDANYANLSAFRTSDPVRTAELLKAAVNVAAAGKCISPYTQKEAPGTYIDIDKALGFYKTSFSTGYYAGVQDNTSVALKMAGAYHAYGDYRKYLYIMDIIKKISADDIIDAITIHMKDAHITWAVSAHPDTVAAVKKQHGVFAPDYESITLE